MSLPPTLKTLKFGLKFNQSLEGIVLPQTLEKLGLKGANGDAEESKKKGINKTETPKKRIKANHEGA